MRYCYAAMMFLLLLPALVMADPQLSYSGSDLSSGTGTMTITCSDGLGGSLWELDIKRMSSSYYAIINRFDDHTDSGAYNYAESYDFGYGLFVGHRKSGTAGTSSYSGTFTELHKDTDYYSYKITMTKTTDGLNQWRQETVYRINPATEQGTQITAESTVTNISGAD